MIDLHVAHRAPAFGLLAFICMLGALGCGGSSGPSQPSGPAATPTPAPTPSPTPAPTPTPISYNGSWSGSTSQGRMFNVNVDDNAIRFLRFSYQVSGPGCTVTIDEDTASTNGPIVNGRATFSASTGNHNVSGDATFSSPSAVTGSVTFVTRSTGACNGLRGTFDWQGRK